MESQSGSEKRPEVGQILYRAEYEEVWGDPSLHFEQYVVVGVTPKGCWVLRDYMNQDYYSEEYKKKLRKFVLDNAAKRYGYPTKLEAVRSLVRRRTMQIRHLTRQLEHATASLEFAKKALKDGEYKGKLEQFGVTQYLRLT